MGVRMGVGGKKEMGKDRGRRVEREWKVLLALSGVIQQCLFRQEG